MSTRKEHTRQSRPVPDNLYGEALSSPRHGRDSKRFSKKPVPPGFTDNEVSRRLKETLASLEKTSRTNDGIGSKGDGNLSDSADIGSTDDMEMDDKGNNDQLGDIGPHDDMWEDNDGKGDFSAANNSMEIDEPDVNIVRVAPPIVIDKKPDPDKSNTPSQKTQSLFTRWSETVYTLANPLLAHLSETDGKELGLIENPKTSCLNPSCTKSQIEILCLAWDHFKYRPVTVCECQDVLYVLVRNGFFPSTPTKPNLAVSIHLLNFYQALFEKSCDAVNALAHALNAVYSRRSFFAIHSNGKPMLDPFRKSLGNTVLWYQVLCDYIEKQTEESIAAAAKCLQTSEITQSVQPQADRVLQTRCAACFSGVTYGKALIEGADIHVCVDGNFNHRHRKAVKNCPQFYTPGFILPKQQVDDMGRLIDTIRKPRKNPRRRMVPDAAVDECKEAHQAGSGSNEKSNMDVFDDGGLMALVCRHDVPLFAANIDTAGEQQKYAITLIEHLFNLLPENATIIVLYDVGCVLDRSLSLYPFLSDSQTNRLGFGTSAMHAYAHQWACQIAYAPRLQDGFGMTDGEGVERLWSRMRKLIPITRGCARNRRLWLIDQQITYIASEIHSDLGAWIIRKLKAVKTQIESARKDLAGCEIDIDKLREEWEDQRMSQVSRKSHAPVTLKRELDILLELQDEADGLKDLISADDKFGKSQGTRDSLKAVQVSYDDVMKNIETLYLSLNVAERFPELQGLSYEFIHHLILARDLKIHIRKRAIGSFFEWDRLNQAAGGKSQALGTKAHQSTRQAMTKRGKTLQRAIRKYNGYCRKLTELYESSWDFPLPEELPEGVGALRKCPHLMEDVWIDREGKEPPEWVSNSNVRDGIQAFLKVDRCEEESTRLQVEAENLLRWFRHEIAAVELAIALPANTTLVMPLRKRRHYLLGLKHKWAVPTLTTETQYRVQEAEAHQAVLTVLEKSGEPVNLSKDSSQVVLVATEIEDEFEAVDNVEQENDEELMISDLLMDTFGDERDDKQVEVIWELPDCQREHPNIFEQLNLVNPSAKQSIDSADWTERCIQTTGERVILGTKTIRVIASMNQCLDDLCINGLGALLLHSHLSPNVVDSSSARECVLFSTFTLPQSQKASKEQVLWRNNYRKRYWEKPIWLFPIHRPSPTGGVGHWVLCTVYLNTKQLFLFDSFADRIIWEAQVPEVVSLIECLLGIAAREGHQLNVQIASDRTWTAHPTIITPCQSNATDCGLWVLAAICAVLNAFTAPGIPEQDMVGFRRLLLGYILSIPSSSLSAS